MTDSTPATAALCPARSPESGAPCTLPDIVAAHSSGHESYTGDNRWVSWATTADERERWLSHA